MLLVVTSFLCACRSDGMADVSEGGGQFDDTGEADDTSGDHPVEEGDLVITEIMRDPVLTNYSPKWAREWIEIVNVSDHDINLEGFEIYAETYLVPVWEPVLVPAGEYALLAGSDDPEDVGGFTVDYAWGKSFPLAAASVIGLRAPSGVVVDRIETRIEQNGGDWPFANSGESHNLDPSSIDHVANDAGTSWCIASMLGIGPRQSSPRAPNAPCD
jgi:hypothetical protein